MVNYIGLRIRAVFAIILLALCVVLTPNISYATLISALVPKSKSAKVDVAVIAYVSVINTGTVKATGCSIKPITKVPATFTYQTTDPTTNFKTRKPNKPIDIAAGATQTFLVKFIPKKSFGPTEIKFNYRCKNKKSATSVSGTNTLVLTTLGKSSVSTISININPLRDLGMSKGENVCFRIKAYNTTSVSKFSNAICSRIRDLDYITLKWNKAIGDVIGYYIYYGANKNNSKTFLFDVHKN